MAFKVEVQELDLSPASGKRRPIQLRINKAMLDKAGRLIGGAKNSTKNQVRKSHDAAQEAVGRALAVGFPGVSAGGSKVLKYTRASGKTGHFSTRPWDPLSVRYARGTPRSTVFWRKHPTPPVQYRKTPGSELRYTLQTLYSLARVETGVPQIVNVRENYTQKGRPGRGNLILSWTIKFNTPDNALKDLISEPMVRGVGAKESRYPGVKREFSEYSPEVGNISQMLWTEGQRPFARDLSFQIGKTLGNTIKQNFAVTVKKISSRAAKTGP